MREYRSKQVDEELENQTFVYGGLYKKEGDKIEDSFITEYYIVDEHGRHIEVFEEFIGQYTGLNDKNGVKIFEGDRVKIVKEFSDGSDWSIKGVVSFENGSFFIEDSHKNGYTCVNNFDGLIEIIGKIHDKEQGK